MSLPVVCCHSLFPFGSSEVETPVDLAPSPMGISTSLDANGWMGHGDFRSLAAKRRRPGARDHPLAVDDDRARDTVDRRPLGPEAHPARQHLRIGEHLRQIVDRPRRHPLGLERERQGLRSEEHTSELQSLMRNSYAVFCLNKHNNTKKRKEYTTQHIT